MNKEGNMKEGGGEEEMGRKRTGTKNTGKMEKKVSQMEGKWRKHLLNSCDHVFPSLIPTANVVLPSENENYVTSSSFRISLRKVMESCPLRQLN